MTTICVLFSFARSGGTLLNQLLGAHPDCWVLSETNPAGSVVPLARQAAEWLGAIEPGERAAFDELSYHEQIARLDALARDRGKTLVIRDWVTVNFLAGASGAAIVPSKVLEQEVYLSRGGYHLTPLVLTRSGAAVYASIRRSFSHLADLSEDRFATAYLEYARAVAAFPRVALEDLRRQSRATLTRALSILDISLDHIDHQLSSFAEFQRCTGNNTLAIASATSLARRVLPPGEEAAGTGFLNEGAAMAEADALLGYGR
ncbi:MAG: hypothetical protein WDA75_18590 [Candidatus Latescibacterota bacterium]|jgi:hypothetical protein